MSRQSLGRADKFADALDRPVLVGNRCGRLVTSADGSVTSLIVGASAGAADVPVRLVEEETLLIRGAHSRRPAEILIGVRTGDNSLDYVVDDVARKSNAASVLVILTGQRNLPDEHWNHQPI